VAGTQCGNEPSGSIQCGESDVHVTVHHDKFLIIKPTGCSDFSNLFLKRNSTCFGQFLCPSSEVFHCIHSNGICHTVLLTAYKQDQPDDGQRNCPKHAEFHINNKFEKLGHLIVFITGNSAGNFMTENRSVSQEGLCYME
jgi:hypothetical protein